jgi:adenylate kinase family enzyme
MKDKLFGLITKYSLLLSAFYILSFAFSRTIIQFEFSDETLSNAGLRQTAPLAFTILLNLITAYIVGRDIKKHSVKTKYVTLATIVYRPLGVFAFLFFLFIQDNYTGHDKQSGD